MRNLLLIPALLFLCQNAFTQTLETIEGCQGEGCGCTRETKTNKEFSLYEKMDVTSKVLGKFKSGTKARAGKVVTQVIRNGKSKVTDAKDTKLGLKVGDEVDTVFYMGEGMHKVKHENKWVEFEDKKIKLKEIEAPKYDTWMEVQTGKLKGYVNTFPFMDCLE